MAVPVCVSVCVPSCVCVYWPQKLTAIIESDYCVAFCPPPQRQWRRRRGTFFHFARISVALFLVFLSVLSFFFFCSPVNRILCALCRYRTVAFVGVCTGVWVCVRSVRAVRLCTNTRLIFWLLRFVCNLILYLSSKFSPQREKVREREEGRKGDRCWKREGKRKKKVGRANSFSRLIKLFRGNV